MRFAGRQYARLRELGPAGIARRLLPAFILDPLRRAAWRVRARRAAPYREALEALRARLPAGRPLIVFPPSLDWHTQLFQRPQQLAIALARAGATVFYLQPRPDRSAPPFQELEEGLFLCNVPVETFWHLPRPVIYLLTWNRKYSGAFQSPRVIYDYVDEIETFWGDHVQMRKDHARLVRSATVVSATARHLYREVAAVREDALLCPNGVDYGHFAGEEGASAPPPADLLPILQAGKPIIGYYGALARWFDYPLLAEVAGLRPDLSFVLIGPDYDRTLSPELVDRPNVHWLGVKAYAELPAYLRCFSVATIPFQLNRITHATSPLKLFEYMAAGKPVVITAMDESRQYPGVLVASDAQDFAAKLDEALRLKDDPDYVALLRSVARENTWEARARQLLQALERAGTL